MVRELLKISTGLALVAGIAAAPASAVTILQFGGSGGTVTATNPTATSTAINTTDLAVGVTLLQNGSAQPAYFSLSALSSGLASSGFGQVGQNFSGTFTINTGLGLSGTNLLSGSFNNIAMLWGNTTTAQLSSGSTASFAFTSAVITSLASPLGLSLSFSDVTPDLHIENGTLAGFRASVSGTFSGSPVPEPASWAMMVGGFGLLGATMRRRRPAMSVSFS
ncbi:PEPxxWA-CTERM sorting domain-containing protein [Sphingomonas sp. BIUV-7]|uniref:PEPxxWA-CTERM sorting domain-containing protein n=1 Tax=Sphingomonas natans TaxID=3063330 RepID=A0ABT8Y5H6_9SPHN|nr:PEPxxWA-CTERM sorting domain-containing protein [Sphingomonas sp. BIUV-7]MDO6413158.1 PEPxxWA-CTERM sorting domain-containing protein [Sphingomonas sp. BIUV-7]